MDSGPLLESRRDEGAATATATETATAREPPPQPDSHELEMRGQGVHAKALRIRAFWSEIGRTAGYPGKSRTRECKRIKMLGTRVVEQHRRRRRNVELLQTQIHEHWTRVQVRWILSRRGRKRPLWQALRTWQSGWMRTTHDHHAWKG